MNPLILLNETIALSRAQNPTAFTLANINGIGVDARVVLAKGLNTSGISFYTNYTSVKARELEENPRVCALFYFDDLGVTFRMHGYVHRLTPQDSDLYWKTRPLLSRVASMASKQSRILPYRMELYLRAFKAMFSKPSVRPVFWGGYHIRVERCEILRMKDFRTHDRTVYERKNSNWQTKKLYP